MLTLGYNLLFQPLAKPVCESTGHCGTHATTNCFVVTGVNNNPSYLDVLLSLQLRYALTQNSALRAVFSRGLARPDPYQLTPYLTEDSTASPTTVAIGNLALRPEHDNNYDLLYKRFLIRGALTKLASSSSSSRSHIEIVLPGNLTLQFSQRLLPGRYLRRPCTEPRRHHHPDRQRPERLSLRT